MWSAIITGATTIASYYMTNRANRRAVERMIAAEERANKIQEAKNDIAKARLQTQRDETASGMANLRQNAGRDPGVMTPAQEQAITEGRRDTLRAISPGMRGSGRTVTAAIRNVEGNTRNRFIDSNQMRKDRASTQLFNAGNTALRDINTIDTGMGDKLAESYLRQGDITAGEEVAKGRIGQDTVTALGRLTADYVSRQKKQDSQVNPSRYGTNVRSGERV